MISHVMVLGKAFSDELASNTTITPSTKHFMFSLEKYNAVCKLCSEENVFVYLSTDFRLFFSFSLNSGVLARKYLLLYSNTVLHVPAPYGLPSVA